MPGAQPSTNRDHLARIGSIGGDVNIGKHGPDFVAARAREGLWHRFLKEANPTGELDDHEAARRATYLRRAHMRRISMLGTAARKEKARERRERVA